MSSLDLKVAGEQVESLPLINDEARPTLRFLVPAAREGTSLYRPARWGDETEGWWAAFLRAGRRWVILPRINGADVTVNGLPILGFKILDHGDLIEIGEIEMRLAEERVEVLTENSDLVKQGRACPVCQRMFEPGHQVHYCPQCELAHHTGKGREHGDCWAFGGKCSSSPFCGYQIRESSDRDNQDAARSRGAK